MGQTIMTSKTPHAGGKAAALLATKLRDIGRAKQQLKEFIAALNELKEANSK